MLFYPVFKSIKLIMKFLVDIDKYFLINILQEEIFLAQLIGYIWTFTPD